MVCVALKDGKIKSFSLRSLLGQYYLDENEECGKCISTEPVAKSVKTCMHSLNLLHYSLVAEWST